MSMRPVKMLWDFLVCVLQLPHSKIPRLIEKRRFSQPYLNSKIKGNTMKDFFNKMVRSKFSILYLILFIGALYLLQQQAIMPLVMKVVGSELFFEKPIEENEPLGKLDAKTERTDFALANCREAVKADGDLPDNSEFIDENYEAWALGNRQYLIRAGVRIADKEKGQFEKPYACTIRLTGEDQTKSDSWKLLGLDFDPAPNN